MKKLITIVSVLLICVTAICAFVACNEREPDLTGLNAAKEYLETMLKDAATVTGADYTRPAVLKNEHGTYTVTWTLSVTSGPAANVTLGEVVNGLVTINVDEFASAETAYTLTAVISDAEGNALDAITYTHKVPKFVLSTYEEYIAACNANDGETIITIKGYVVGINADSGSSSKGSIWLVDENGKGYYAYKPALAAEITASREAMNAAFPRGKEIVVKGTVTKYGGCYEFNSACEVISTGNSVDPATLAYVDQTELFGSAANMNDEATLAATQSTRVALNNVTMGRIDGYNYYFKVNGKEFICYMNIYLLSEEENATLAAKWTEGGKANLTGVINVYSSKYQIYPDSVNAIVPVEENLTDAEKVERQKEILTLESSYEADFTLPEGTWADVEWSVEGAGAVIGENNAVTLNQTNEDQTVIFTATITSGEATDTASFTVIIKSSIIDWKDAEFAVTECAKLNGAEYEKGTEQYYFYGIIGTTPTADYCNFDLIDGKGNSILVYGLYAKNGTDRYGTKRQIAEIPFAQGDLICMRGNLQNYNGKYEIINAVEVDIPAKGSAIANPYTAADAATECAKLNGATQEKTEDYFYFKGLVGTTPTATYCNFDFMDEMGSETSLLVYGLYAADGTNRYGSNREIADIPIKAGDVVILKAKLQNYNGTLQIANAILVDYYTPETTDDGEPESCAHSDAALDGTCDVCNQPYDHATVHAGTAADPYTVADIIKYSKYLPQNKWSAEMVYVTGYIKSMNDKGSYVQNIYLVDETGATTSFLVYSANYTTSVTAVAVGDKVTIKGAIKNYNGTLEMTNVKDSDNNTVHGYPTFEALVTVGQGTITVDADNATVVITDSITEGANHTTFTFTVTAAAGYSISEVKVNGKVVTATGDVYTGTILGATTIKVTALAAGATAPKTYVFANYTAGTQYAEDEVHELDANTTVTTTQAHFTSQLRLYSSSSHDGFAIIQSVDAVTKLDVNAGNKADKLVVYVSNDGTTWTEAGKISVTEAYADYSLDLGGSYNYIKLDVEGTQQIRIVSMTLNF